ncbi:beta-phosphoglucomutase [Flavobacteriaceae bacterium]|nr:beta-phosphoglucomutase [Flavobacteriaceae bacterium]
MNHNICALFDLDGVIVDTAKYHFFAWKKIAKELDYELTEAANEQLKGISRVDSLKKIIDWSGVAVSERRFQDFMQIKNDDYLKFIEDINESDILPGVRDALDFLRENRIKIGLGSASKNAVPILDRLSITPYFKTIIDGNSVSRSKPDPEVFLKGAKALNVSPNQTVVFEDSTAGIIAAKAGGMTGVALGETKLFKNADFCYPDFTAINSQELMRLFSIE